jgi:phytanoyl-CoA hydroxylase
MAVPESISDDRPYFTIDQLDSCYAYYLEQGYVVVRGLVSPGLCDRVIDEFNGQARYSRVPMLRQKNMRYERNAFDQNGYLSNPIFNIQDLQSADFGAFKSAALDIYTDPNVARTARRLLGKGPAGGVRLVESMFFEAPAGTWPHQDSYYQDSAAKLGGATAAWFALEEISAKAGRFYVCPMSHLQLPLLMNRGLANFGDGHEQYQKSILDIARKHSVEWRAPFLAKGDVLFWNSRTIHGSLPPYEQSTSSRRSLTGHYLSDGDELQQFHSRIRRQKIRHHNGTQIGLLHDQDDLRNRVVRRIAHQFPTLWSFARRVAIKALVHGHSVEIDPEVGNSGD